VLDKIKQILGGHESVKLYLQFLRQNNKTDMAILKNTKVSSESSDLGLFIVPETPIRSGCSGCSFVDIPQRRDLSERVYALRDHF
jgi:hypothetical protein